MQDYAAQVPVADRWAIAAYIRALQLSQRATVDDVPADRRGDARRGRARTRSRRRRPMSVDMTYSPPAADIDARRSRALMAGGVGLAGCARSGSSSIATTSSGRG